MQKGWQKADFGFKCKLLNQLRVNSLFFVNSLFKYDLENSSFYLMWNKSNDDDDDDDNNNNNDNNDNDNNNNNNNNVNKCPRYCN